MTDQELATLLLKNAVNTQRENPNEYAEANADSAILALGNARIANMLELLGQHQIVSDVQPTFSRNGLGFSYCISPELLIELTSEDMIVSRVEAMLEGSPTETATTVLKLQKDCEKSNLNAVYRDDLLASLKELRLCFNHECYIACLALSGKILEISLKQALIDNQVDFDNSWMIGRLITVFRNANLETYIDQSLPDIAKIINQSRIPAVHAKERIPVPSKNQAIMVIHAVVDTVNRVIVKA